MASSAKQYSLCYYTSYIPVTLQVSSAKQFHCVLIANYINIKNNNNNITKSSSLHSVVLNTWSKHYGYSWHYYYANAHSCYNTEPNLMTLTKHSHMDWHVNTLTHACYSTHSTFMLWQTHLWVALSWLTLIKVHWSEVYINHFYTQYMYCIYIKYYICIYYNFG